MKTPWQKFYSFFGFWKYTWVVPDNDAGDFTEYTVIYWCMFPWKFCRKFDVFWWKTCSYNVHEELKRVNALLDAKLK